MPKAVAAAALVLAGCSTPPGDPPVHEELPGRECHTTELDRFTGQLATAELGAAILRQSNAAVLRWVPHGAMITMEYRADRVTVSLSAENRVERLSCG